MTSSSKTKLSISILQASIKLTMEPITGLKVSILSLLNKVDHHMVDAEDNHRKLVFGLCFAHASIEERKRFGAIG